MRLALNRQLVFSMLVIFSMTALSLTGAQERTEGDNRQSQATVPRAVQDKIPRAALLTERGTQLANRLKFLRQSELTMGQKHPQFESVQDEIEEIKRELTAWSPAEWFDSDVGEGALAQRLPEMNDRDLRQVVLQLVGKIEQLENRVAELEQVPIDL